MEKEQIANWFKSLQDIICRRLETLDGESTFHEDQWSRAEGGGGRSRIFENGRVIEKGGVNFSAVHGQTPEKIIQKLQLEPADFYATGISIVLHPQNPWVPIIHMNLRYFEMSNGVYWFGGGIDVTPHYINLENARHFHRHLQEVCDRHHPEYYQRFKKWADDYFYIRHRKETRGIGGIFFDRLTGDAEQTAHQRMNFVKDVGQVFYPQYENLVKTNQLKEYGAREKEWQYLRRGRYVEFNLVWDKGTKFGLDTDGRTESILMSLPPMARWQYDHHPAEGSPESLTLKWLRKDVDWVNGNNHE